VQEKSYPRAAYNNTYGIKAISEEQYNSAVHDFYKPGGAKDKIEACQAAADKLDPAFEGDVASVNALCKDAADYVNSNVEGLFNQAGLVSFVFSCNTNIRNVLIQSSADIMT